MDWLNEDLNEWIGIPLRFVDYDYEQEMCILSVNSGVWTASYGGNLHGPIEAFVSEIVMREWLDTRQAQPVPQLERDAQHAR